MKPLPIQLKNIQKLRFPFVLVSIKSKVIVTQLLKTITKPKYLMLQHILMTIYHETSEGNKLLDENNGNP